MESRESEERGKEKRVRKEKEKRRGARNGGRGLSISKVMMIMMMIMLMIMMMIVMRGRLKNLGRRKSFALQRFEPEPCTSEDQERRRMDDDGSDCREIILSHNQEEVTSKSWHWKEEQKRNTAATFQL